MKVVSSLTSIIMTLVFFGTGSVIVYDGVTRNSTGYVFLGGVAIGLALIVLAVFAAELLEETLSRFFDKKQKDKPEP